MYNSAPVIQVIDKRENDTQPVTAVISQRVRRNREADYEEWIQSISAVAKTFPGHRGVSVIRPEAGICSEYVTVLKFDCYTNLKRWLDSDERRAWTEKARPLVVNTAKIQVLTGFETWFTVPNLNSQPAPPRYKMSLLSTIAVFSVANLLHPRMQPLLAFLPDLLSSLVTTYVGVLLLTYIVMPRLTKLFFRWLYPA